MAFSVEESRLLGEAMDPGRVEWWLLVDCRAAVYREHRREESKVANLPDWCREALGL